jgi:hypothetical protein
MFTLAGLLGVAVTAAVWAAGPFRRLSRVAAPTPEVALDAAA